MAKRIKAKEGDLVFIQDYQFKDQPYRLYGNFRVARLVYVSKLHKGAIGLILSKLAYEQAPTDLEHIEFMSQVIYSDDTFIKSGGWQVLGNRPLNEQEEQLSLRRVANSIMLKDEYLRICTDEDYKNFINTPNHYMGALYTALNYKTRHYNLIAENAKPVPEYAEEVVQPAPTFNPNNLLKPMFEDDYYPNNLVEKIKQELQKLISSVQTAVQTKAPLQPLFDQFCQGLNAMEQDFLAQESDLETQARDYIAQDIEGIIQHFKLNIDLETALAQLDV